jgi:hypothetical protein
MNRIAGATILILMASIFSSCSFMKVVKGKKQKDPDKKVVWTGADTSHVTTNVTPKDTLVQSATSVINVNPLIEQLKPVWNKRLAYKTFSGKAKMHFESPDNKLEFTGHFRVKRDSAIWINITAIGGVVQAARIFITPDSFYLINSQQGEVTILPLSEADKFLPAKVDFSSLQNLIIGEPIREGIITDAERMGDSIILRVEDSSYLQNIVFNNTDSTLRRGHLRTRKPNGPAAETEYNSYITLPNGKISTYRVINLSNRNDNYSLEMNFSKIEFDIPVDMPFRIPENYTIKR